MNNIRFLVLLFCSLIFSLEGTAQTSLAEVDSIYRFAKAHPADESAHQSLNSVLTTIYTDNSDTASYYASYQTDAAKSNAWRTLEGMGLLMQGVSLEFKGDLDSAMWYYRKVKLIGTISRDSTIRAYGHNSMARIYSKKGLYQLSIEEVLKAIELVSSGGDQLRNANILNSVGLTLLELNRNEQAIGLLKTSERLSLSSGDTMWLTNSYNLLGRAYRGIEKLDSSDIYYRKSIHLSRIFGNRYHQMNGYHGLATNYLASLKLDSATWAIDSVEDIAHEINDVYRINEADVIRGKVLLAQGFYMQAVSYLKHALTWFDNENYASTSIDIHNALVVAYDSLGEDEIALEHHKTLSKLKDKLYLEQREQANQQVDIYRQQRQEKEKDLLNNQLEHQTGLRNVFFIIGVLAIVLLLVIANRYRYERKTKRLLAQKNAIIEFEKDRSEQLLLNILPEEVAEELKETGRSEARHFDGVNVLFTDFVSFTSIAEKLTPQELVSEIDHCFKGFDEIMTKRGIEKIKTIGDAYMAADGLNDDTDVSPANLVMAALEMQKFLKSYGEELSSKGKRAFEMRVGIHTGSVVAGIVGHKKFQYDIWGDAVNTASRMESHGGIGKVNISGDTYEILRDDPNFQFESRGKLEVKGKGAVEMYFVAKN